MKLKARLGINWSVLKTVPLLATWAILVAGCGPSSAEQAALAQDRQEIERLRQENQDLAKLRLEHEEVQRLRKENQEIAKLRGQYQELLRLRKENEQLRSQLAKLQSATKQPR